MRRPPLLISLPLPSDLPAIASLHQRAFWPSHFFRMMFDSDTHCVQPSDWGAWHLQRLVKWSASEAEGEGTHVTAVAKRGELLLGYGHFMVHENVEGEEAEEEGGGDDYPEGTDLEAARSVFGGMEAAERLIKGKFVGEMSFCIYSVPSSPKADLFRASSPPSTRHGSFTSKDGSRSCSPALVRPEGTYHGLR